MKRFPLGRAATTFPEQVNLNSRNFPIPRPAVSGWMFVLLGLMYMACMPDVSLHPMPRTLAIGN